jgi:hypothetical protein
MALDISHFTVEHDEREEYKYKVLIYGNYTYRDNLEADSLVIVLRNVIPFLSKRYNVHFTILVPEVIKSLSFANVDQIIWKLPTYINTMRTHFDATEFLKIINWREKDFDIIYSHLPEHTAQIANCIYNNSHFRPKIVGYSHWFEVKENAPYEKTMFLASMAGLLEMEECGVNSNWLKQLTLKEASKYFKDDIVEKLEKIIQPHYLGVDMTLDRSPSVKKKSVIFNHRPSGYTGWDWFTDVVDEVWKTRQDFTVYSTLAQVDRPWNQKVTTKTRTEYMEMLRSMQFGVGCFQSYSAWSISVTDGLSVNVPYLLPRELCYPEMVPSDYPYLFSNREEFIQKFNQMLDSNELIDTREIAEAMVWETRIEKWFGGWDKVFTLHAMSDTDGVKKVINLINKNKYITKKDLLDKLGWGVHIKWTGYRNKLREHPNIILTKHGYEWRD